MTEKEAQKIIENPAEETIIRIARALATTEGGGITGLLMIRVGENETIPIAISISTLSQADELGALVAMLMNDDEGGDDGDDEDEGGMFVTRPAKA